MTSTTQPDSKKFTIGLLAILLVGLCLRLVMSVQPSIKVEESLYLTYASTPSQWLQGTQPPFFMLLLFGWIKLFGDNLFVMRLLSCLFGTLSIFFAGLLAKQIAGKPFGIITAILVATNPLLVFIGALAEPYALLIMLIFLAFYLMLSILDSGSADPLKTSLLSLTLLLGFFTHFYFSILIPLMILYLFFFRKTSLQQGEIKKNLFLSFGIAAGGMVLYSPLAWIQAKRYLVQISQNHSAIRFPDTRLISWFEQTSQAITIDIFSWPGPVFAWVGFLLMAYGAYLSIRRRQNIDATPHFLFFIAFLFLIIASLFIPIINEHSIWFLLPGGILFIGLGMMGLGKLRWIVTGIFALVGIVSIFYTVYWAPFAWKSPPDWIDVSNRIVSMSAPGDGIAVEPAWMSMALKYHLEHTEQPEGRKASDLPFINPEKIHVEQDNGLNKIFLICVRGHSCSRKDVILEENGFKQLDQFFMDGLKYEIFQTKMTETLDEE